MVLSFGEEEHTEGGCSVKKEEKWVTRALLCCRILKGTVQYTILGYCSRVRLYWILQFDFDHAGIRESTAKQSLFPDPITVFLVTPMTTTEVDFTPAASRINDGRMGWCAFQAIRNRAGAPSHGLGEKTSNG